MEIMVTEKLGSFGKWKISSWQRRKRAAKVHIVIASCITSLVITY